MMSTETNPYLFNDPILLIIKSIRGCEETKSFIHSMKVYLASCYEFTSHVCILLDIHLLHHPSSIVISQESSAPTKTLKRTKSSGFCLLLLENFEIAWHSSPFKITHKTLFILCFFFSNFQNK